MSKRDQRFECILKEGSQIRDEGMKQILVDKETGVHYLWVKSGYASGFTPLLDVEGKPVIKRPY